MRSAFLLFILALSLSSTSVFGQWTRTFYIDDFGDKSTQSYLLYTDEDGSFSDKAYTNQKLTAKVMFEISPEHKPNFSFKMYELQKGHATGKPLRQTKTTYTLSVKLANNNVETYKLVATDSALVMDNAADNELFYKHLVSETNAIKCHIKLTYESFESYRDRAYNFVIIPAGFAVEAAKIEE